MIKIFRECQEDAKELAMDKADIIFAAAALFEKRADKIFTVLENKLTEKVKKCRNQN